MIRRFIALGIAVLIILLGLPGVPASASLRDCFELKFPSAIAGSNSISLSAKVYAKCTKAQLGMAWNSSFVFSVQEETAPFGLSYSCSGPLAGDTTPTIGPLGIGTLTCRLKTGSEPFASSRVGSTSSTLRMWLAWDFSEWTIGVSHSAIPAKQEIGGSSSGGSNSSNGSSSGGSSSGSSGGSSGGSTPIIPSCTRAPSKPNLQVNWSEKGPEFSASATHNGGEPSSLYWSFNLLDASTSRWESWRGWQIAPLTFSYSPEVNSKYSKIAFAVYATNACGSSEQARENATNTGVAFAGLVQDSLSEKSSAKSIEVGSSENSLFSFVTSRNNLALFLTSETSDTCIIEKGLIVAKSLGNCELKITSQSKENVKGVSDFLLTLKVVKRENKISESISRSGFVGNSLYFSVTSTSGIATSLQSLTPSICEISANSIKLSGAGICRIGVTAPETPTFAANSSEIVIAVLRGTQQIDVVTRSFAMDMSEKFLDLDAKSSVYLPLSSKSLTSKICEISGLTIRAKKPGECQIQLSQLGNTRYNAAAPVTITGFIAEDRFKITCVKGSVTKKIKAVKPKCPNGYKKK